MMKKIALAASSVIVASAFTASMAAAQVGPGNYVATTPSRTMTSCSGAPWGSAAG